MDRKAIENKLEKIEPDFEFLVNNLSGFFQKHFPAQEMGKDPSSEVQLLIKMITGLVQSRMGISTSSSAQLFTYFHNHLKFIEKLEKSEEI